MSARRGRSRGSLTLYRSRRDFRRSPEPSGRDGRPSGWRRSNPIFVVQKHDASHLHYDFRLQLGRVLKSWAVPKGPSTNPRERRLAVQVEDHPLAYADFEGVIPEGHYGGGTVIVWDAGPYRNLRRDAKGRSVPMQRALRDGRVEVWLEGRKIRGGYALIRTRLDRNGARRKWLLVKMGDAAADARRRPTRTQPRSVLTGRTLAQVAREEGAAGRRARPKRRRGRGR